jgi:hypothetical protein
VANTTPGRLEDALDAVTTFHERHIAELRIACERAS